MAYDLSPSPVSAQENETLVADGLERIDDAVAFLKVSRSKLYQMMDQGDLAFVKFGKARRIPRKALVELAANSLVRR